MRILNVLLYSPIPPVFGGALRLYNLLKWMAQHHEVTVLMYGAEGDAAGIEAALGQPVARTHVVPTPRWTEGGWKRFAQLQAVIQNRSFDEVSLRRPEMQQNLDRLLDRHEFDMVQISCPAMGYFRYNTDAASILDEHNIEYDLYRRLAEGSTSPVRKWWASFEYHRFYPHETALCARQSAVFVTSERDRQVLHRDVPDVPTYVIPNGVDTQYFQGTPASSDAPTIVLTGAFNYRPNAEGVERFITTILPLIRRAVPDVKFFVVGNRPTKALLRLASDHVIITGRVEDVRPYVRQATVYVVPVWIGGGTRLKLLEAMSMRRPVVTTTVGCEGVSVRDGETALIADEPQQFAESVIRLLRDPAQRTSLVENAYSLVRAQFDWSVIGERIEVAYSQVLKAHKSRAKDAA